MIYDVYVGSYTKRNGGDGIYHIKLDTEAKSLTPVTSYPENSDNSSFLVVKPDHVYAVSENAPFGYMSAFRRDPETGSLTFQNRIETPGVAMCHLTMWPDGKHLSGTNYGNGSVVVCSLAEDGSMDKLCDEKQHTGVGFDSTGRQAGPHAHSSLAAPNGKELYVADLGLDWLACYEMQTDGTLVLADEARQIKTPDGEGPRHFVFSDDGRFLYLVTEMGNKLLVYEEADGKYQLVQQENLLPPDFEGFNTAADIHFSYDKKFIYGSCRGRDCLTAFRVDQQTGRVTLTGYYDSWGKGPRNFCIVPGDEFALITNQMSGNLVLCPRDVETGAIGDPVAELKIPQAVYVSVI